MKANFQGLLRKPMKITYYTQRYLPDREGISKEVEHLVSTFGKENRVKIHDLHLDGLTNFKCNSSMISAHFLYYPLLLPYTKYLGRKSDINHIYTSLGDLPYLPILNPKNTILTAAASCNFEKITKRLRYLEQLKIIVVETEKQKIELVQLGIDEKKIEIIPPPVEMRHFTYNQPTKNFTILYASCPTRSEDFEKRGIFLLLDYAKKNKNVNIDLVWRLGGYDDIKKIIEGIPNIAITNAIIKNMNERYALAHCTIIPYTVQDDFLKMIPNSAIESLAAGKPILVSTKCELAKLVELTHCGVTFEPNVEGLTEAIEELKKNYNFFQKNCQKTALEYFSKDKFIASYQKIYKRIMENEH